MSSLTNKQKRRLAFTLYCHADMKTSVIADEIGVSERSIRNWKKEEKWDQIKAAKTLTKSEIVANLYNSTHDIQKDWIKEKRRPTTAEIDMLAKMGATIARYEKATALPTIIEVFMNFNKWLISVDPEAARLLNSFQYQYIKVKGSEY